MELRGGFSELETQQEGFQRGVRTFDFDEDALRGVVYPAPQAGLGGELVNERTEAHALDGTADGNLQPAVRSNLRHNGGMLYGGGVL